ARGALEGRDAGLTGTRSGRGEKLKRAANVTSPKGEVAFMDLGHEGCGGLWNRAAERHACNNLSEPRRKVLSDRMSVVHRNRKRAESPEGGITSVGLARLGLEHGKIC